MGQRSNLNIGEPEPHSLEALLHCNIIHHHHTICLAKELLGYAAVPVSVAGFECQHSAVAHFSNVSIRIHYVHPPQY